MSDPVNIEDYSVKIDGDTYFMKKLPPPDSKLVTDERARVLKTIKLEKLIEGLSRTGDLINLAYNATPAKFGNLRAPMAKLQDRFGGLCAKCIQEMDSVAEATRAILPNITRTFTFLLDGKDELAISFLSRCAAQAQKLSDSVGSLAKEFDALADETMKILSDAELERGVQIQKAEELRAKAKDLEAKTAEAKLLAEKLAESKKELQRLYDQAKEKAETAENRAFALSMVSAIMKPLGEGLGAFASAYSQSANPLSRLMPPATPKKTKTDKDEPPKGKPESKEELEVKKGTAEKALEAAKAKKKAADTAVETAKKRVTTAKTSVEGAEKAVTEAKDEKEKKAATETLSTAKAEKSDADVVLENKEKDQKTAATEEEKAESNLKAIMAALQGLGKAVSEVGTAVGQMGNDYNAAAEGYRKEKLKYLDMLMEKQDKERETLASMQRYAIEMKNMGEQEQTAEVTASALFQAIAALKQVVVVLRDASLFWSNMAEHCKRLANPAMKQDIEDFKNEDRETKLAIYREDSFKESVVRYYAGWIALQSIAEQYMRETAEVRERVKSDFANYLDDKAARAKATQLGDLLLKEFQKDLDANDKMKDGIRSAQSDTQQETKAA